MTDKTDQIQLHNDILGYECFMFNLCFLASIMDVIVDRNSLLLGSLKFQNIFKRLYLNAQ